MLNLLLQHPRRVFAGVAAMSAGMLAFGILYLQNVLGLHPCPMCIVQRELFMILIALCVVAACFPKRALHTTMAVLGLLTCAFGMFTAARQSWLQWYPPEFATCGRDLYGIIESFPLSRILPMIFKGSGDCSTIDWKFLGLTIANWSFVWFFIFGITMLLLMFRKRKA